MLDEEVLALARQSIEGKLIKLGADLTSEVATTKSQAAMTGNLQSSSFGSSMLRIQASQVNKRAWLAWNELKRVHEAMGSPRSDTLAADFKSEVTGHITEAVEHAKAEFAKQTGQPVTPRPGTASAAPGALSAAGEAAKKEIWPEIDIYVASVDRK